MYRIMMLVYYLYLIPKLKSLRLILLRVFLLILFPKSIRPEFHHHRNSMISLNQRKLVVIPKQTIPLRFTVALMNTQPPLPDNSRHLGPFEFSTENNTFLESLSVEHSVSSSNNDEYYPISI